VCGLLHRSVSTRGLVVLASGNGSNFEAIVKASNEGLLNAEIAQLIVDRDCHAIERARKLSVPCRKLNESWRSDLETLLDEISPSLIVLAGFLRILPKRIVKKWRWKILNIHPSLLPAFPGMHAIRKAYEHGVKVTGVTIHFVDEGVDTGPIILQKAIEVDPAWSLSELEERIHKLEHYWYSRTIEVILNGGWHIEGRRVFIEKDTRQLV